VKILGRKGIEMKKALSMFKKGMFIALILAMFLVSCGPQPVADLPTPQAEVTTVPDVETNAQAFLTAWQAQDYAAMYAMFRRIPNKPSARLILQLTTRIRFPTQRCNRSQPNCYPPLSALINRPQLAM
jgi:hypothetical protein